MQREIEAFTKKLSDLRQKMRTQSLKFSLELLFKSRVFVIYGNKNTHFKIALCIWFQIIRSDNGVLKPI